MAPNESSKVSALAPRNAFRNNCRKTYTRHRNKKIDAFYVAMKFS